MMFTTRALASQIITQDEANTIEDWIDEALTIGDNMTVPDNLHSLWEKIALFNFSGSEQ